MKSPVVVQVLIYSPCTLNNGSDLWNGLYVFFLHNWKCQYLNQSDGFLKQRNLNYVIIVISLVLSCKFYYQKILEKLKEINGP